MKNSAKPDPHEQAQTAHDRYFRYVFTQPEPLHDLALNAVWRALWSSDEVDVGSEGGQVPPEQQFTVESSPTTFVDSEFTEPRTDLLLTLKSFGGTEIAVYLLLEHKERNQWGTIYQLMICSAAVLEHIAAEPGRKGAPPPPVVSVVVYNGPGRWTAPTELSRALGLNESQTAYMNHFSAFRHLVYDVGESLRDEFIGGPLARAALQAMHAAAREMGKDGVLKVVRSLTNPRLPKEFRDATLEYLCDGRPDSAESVLAKLKEER